MPAAAGVQEGFSRRRLAWTLHSAHPARGQEDQVLRYIAIVAVLGFGAIQAEARDSTRIYLDLDRGGLYGFGIDYRDYGHRHDRYRDHRYRDHRYRHDGRRYYGPPYGHAWGYRDRARYHYRDGRRDGWREGWRDARRYDRHRDYKRRDHRWRDRDD